MKKAKGPLDEFPRLEPGQFLLVVPELKLQEIYDHYPAALREATDFASRYTTRIWNYQNRLVYGSTK